VVGIKFKRTQNKFCSAEVIELSDLGSAVVAMITLQSFLFEGSDLTSSVGADSHVHGTKISSHLSLHSSTIHTTFLYNFLQHTLNHFIHELHFSFCKRNNEVYFPEFFLILFFPKYPYFYILQFSFTFVTVCPFRFISNSINGHMDAP